MVDLNAIKIDKFFNIQRDKNEPEKQTSKLIYFIRQYPCFPENTQFVYQPEMLYTKDLKLFLDTLNNDENFSNLKRLNIYQIEIMNIGSCAIQGADFFNNSKLRIENCDFYVGFIDNTFTKPYINVKIEKYEDYAYYIDFDYLKPNDSIYISFISDKQACASYTAVKGETKDFDAPISFHENNIINKKTFIKKSLMNFILRVTFFIFLILFIYYINSELSKIAGKSPILKINFSIENLKK